MATAGNTITAAAFNVVKSKLTQIMGTGVGDKGYGQTLVLPNVTTSPTRKIQAADVQSLKTYLQIARRHQLGNAVGFSEAELPTVAKDSFIKALDFSKYEAAADVVYANALAYGIGSMVMTGAAHSVVRRSQWGPRQTIATEVDLTWRSEDQARWFFNSGGEIRLTPSQTSAGNAGSNSWVRMLGRVGTIKLAAHTSTRTGSAGTAAANIGYYELSGSRAVIYNGLNIDDTWNPAYAFKDDFFVYAHKIANGLSFRVEFVEENHDQSIFPGTTVTFGLLRAVTYLNTPVISPPSFSTRIAL